ncbi:hypothetical protein BJ878DRAFT_543303 [Calycina marina]|uniref:Uncharacterized protein n=1 Tax=Calycina marina TaxID=1763456 RepID=A0A9P8CFJ0_9HELO|nr:hypothetical protein BJ878DRAFT_543303 [Calycina marina]
MAQVGKVALILSLTEDAYAIGLYKRMYLCLAPPIPQKPSGCITKLQGPNAKPAKNDMGSGDWSAYLNAKGVKAVIGAVHMDGGQQAVSKVALDLGNRYGALIFIMVASEAKRLREILRIQNY